MFGQMRGRPRKKTFNDAGHAHELTFSTYRRAWVFLDARACEALLRSLDAARKKHCFEVWAYVLMPDHVHLLVWPRNSAYDTASFLQDLKRPFAKDHLAALTGEGSPLLERLSVPGTEGRQRRQIWQPGGGYDRNIHSAATTKKSIDYIHFNPVVAGLCKRSEDYPWSSAAWYAGLPARFEVDRAKY